MKRTTPRRCRLTSDALNSYGFRVLTEGVDITLYEKNPVLLYMHQRGTVIGYIDAIERTGTEITGELVFDEASELSQRCKKQWECGSLRMVSVGFEVIETSAEPELLVQGQTQETVTKCRLYEVSLVDVGANPEAIVLKRNGKTINLADGTSLDDTVIRPLNNIYVNNNNNNNVTKTLTDMELKAIALALDLSETATEDEVMLACKNSVELRNKNKDLMEQLQTARENAIVELVDKAVTDGRIDATKKNHFVELGKKVGPGTLKDTLDAMQPRTKLADMLNTTSPHNAEWKKLSDVPADQLLTLRETDIETYRRLYKAEYGIDM